MVLKQVQDLVNKFVSKQTEKIERLRNFVQTQESEETNTFLINEEVLQKSKKAHDEVCKYIA